MSNIIDVLEKEQLRQIPEFNPGDTVVVQVKVKEGERERIGHMVQVLSVFFKLTALSLVRLQLSVAAMSVALNCITYVT